MHVCIYTHNKYRKYTHICKQKLLLWMRLIAINRLTALVFLYILYTILILKPNYILMYNFFIIVNRWCFLHITPTLFSRFI